MQRQIHQFRTSQLSFIGVHLLRVNEKQPIWTFPCQDGTLLMRLESHPSWSNHTSTCCGFAKPFKALKLLMASGIMNVIPKLTEILGIEHCLAWDDWCEGVSRRDTSVPVSDDWDFESMTTGLMTSTKCSVCSNALTARWGPRTIVDMFIRPGCVADPAEFVFALDTLLRIY